jgi:hypothetical protein
VRSEDYRAGGWDDPRGRRTDECGSDGVAGLGLVEPEVTEIHEGPCGAGWCASSITRAENPRYDERVRHGVPVTADGARCGGRGKQRPAKMAVAITRAERRR